MNACFYTDERVFPNAHFEIIGKVKVLLFIIRAFRKLD